jgi:outer membrane protein assembly factor BamA
VQAQEEQESENGLSGVPIIAYLPEAGFIAGGYGVYHFRFAGQPASEPASTLPLLAAVTSDKEFGIESTPEIFLPGKAYWLVFDLSARLVPDQSFFGMGNDTRAEDEESYRETVLGLDSSWRGRIVDGLYLGVAQTLQWRRVRDVDPDGLLAAARPPGIEGGVTSGLGPELVYDTRDNTFAPLRGSYIVFAIPVHGTTIGSEWTFTRLTLDARHYQAIPGGRHVLAFHLLFDAVLGTAPFDRQAELASATALRGYLRGRFRDRRALSFEIEYRFPIYWRFGGALFVGVGQVAPSVSDLAFDRFHFAGGGGIRFALVPEERINLRLDVGATPDGVHPYFAPAEFY